MLCARPIFFASEIVVQPFGLSADFLAVVHHSRKSIVFSMQLCVVWIIDTAWGRGKRWYPRGRGSIFLLLTAVAAKKIQKRHVGHFVHKFVGVRPESRDSFFIFFDLRGGAK